MGDGCWQFSFSVSFFNSISISISIVVVVVVVVVANDAAFVKCKDVFQLRNFSPKMQSHTQDQNLKLKPCLTGQTHYTLLLLDFYLTGQDLSENKRNQKKKNQKEPKKEEENIIIISKFIIVVVVVIFFFLVFPWFSFDWLYNEIQLVTHILN